MLRVRTDVRPRVGADTAPRLLRIAASSAPIWSAWLPDPYRHHALRYWDGERWTEHVSDAGDTKTDPPPEGASAPPPTATGVLGAPTLTFEYAGPNAKPGWPVFDQDHEQVAWVQEPRGFAIGQQPYHLLGNDGAPVLTVAGTKSGSEGLFDRTLAVIGPQGQEYGRFGPPVSQWQVTFGFGESKPQQIDYPVSSGGTEVGRLRGTVSRFEGTGLVEDAEHHQVATVTHAEEKISTFKVRQFFVLVRPPELTDPLRLLALAAPVVLQIGVGWQQSLHSRRRSRRLGR
jgi:hypothetical protein